METKKPTNAQLQRKINNAVVHIDRTKDTKEVYFDDRGMRITVTPDLAVLSTGVYTSVFYRVYSGGESNQYLCLSALVAKALEYDKEITVKTKDSVFRSYSLLHKVLDEKKESLSVWLDVMDWWLYNYETSIALAPREDVNNATFFNIYEKYLHSLITNNVFLGEHKEQMTSKQYLIAIADKMKEICDGMQDEIVMFNAKTDDEMIEEEINAVKEQQIEQEMTNGEQQQ